MSTTATHGHAHWHTLMHDTQAHTSRPAGTPMEPTTGNCHRSTTHLPHLTLSLTWPSWGPTSNVCTGKGNGLTPMPHPHSPCQEGDLP